MRKKLATGGALDPVAIANLLSQITNAAGQKSNGLQTNTSAIASGALNGAGIGSQIGSILPGAGNVIGGGIGAIIGGVSSLNRNKKALEEFSRINTKENENKSKMLNQLDIAKNANFNQGNAYQSYFKNGGKLPFKILGANTVKVKGKKHEEGGVKIGAVEVEKGEVIHGNKVYSNRLKLPGTNKTFASAAEEITEQPSYRTLRKKISNLEESDSNLKMGLYQSGTIARNLQKAITPLNNLFQLQEAQKSMKVTKKFAYGGVLGEPNIATEGLKLFNKYKKPGLEYLNRKNREMEERSKLVENNIIPEAINEPSIETKPITTLENKAKNSPLFTGKNVIDKLGNAVPYVDNIVNAILTQKSPQVPVPNMEIAPNLKTTYNIQPQLSEIDRQNLATTRTLKDNISDGASLRGSLIGQNINNIMLKNNLLGQKENVETDLKNKQAMVNADTVNRNASIRSAYDLRKFGRNADQQTRISQNTANAVEDTQQLQIDKLLETYSKQDLELLLKKYGKSGVLSRAGITK